MHDFISDNFTLNYIQTKTKVIEKSDIRPYQGQIRHIHKT